MTEERKKQLDTYINASDDAVVEFTIRERHYETMKFDPEIAGSYYHRDMAFLLRLIDGLRAKVAELEKELAEGG